MMDRIELLKEANRRGILPPEKKALFDEAVKRGLIKVESHQVTPETAQKLKDFDAARERNNELMRRSGASDEVLMKTGAIGTPMRGEERARANAELEKQGVITNAELPAGNVEMGFAKDPVKGLQRSLTEHFGQEVEVYKNKDDIIYVDPTDGQKKLANPDWVSKLGQGLPIAGDIAGTVGGGVLGGAVTKTPAGFIAGESIGAGFGTGTGEAIRLTVGNALGVNDLTTEEILLESAKNGGKAAAATAVTGAALASMKGINNFVKGGIFTREEAAHHGLSVKEADEAIKEVNRIIGKDNAVIGTMGKKTNDVVAQAGEAQVRKNIAHAQDFANRDAADTLGLNKALDKVTKPGAKKGGQAVQDLAMKQSEKRLSQGKSIVAQNEKEFAKQLDDIGKVSKENVGAPARDAILQKRQLQKGAEDAAWERVKKSGGYNPESRTYGVSIEGGDSTKKLIAELKRRSDTATTRVVNKGTGGIFKSGNAKADLADYNREISTLRKELRAATKNKQFGDPDTADLNRVIHSMVKDRRAALIRAGKGDLLKKIEKAERATIKFHELYDRSVIGDLTAKNANGVFKIKEKDFINHTLKSDKEEVRQLMNVIGDNASLVTKMKEGIADAYKSAAYPKGKFNADASKKFISANRDSLSALFKKSELDKWSKTGGLAEKVAKQSKQLDDLIKSANNKWGRGKLKSMDAENLMKFVTNESGSFSTPTGAGVQSMIKKVQYVKNITKNHPATWEKFKTEYSTKFRDEVFNAKSGKIDAKKMDKAIRSQSRAIETVMGKKYLNDLKSINKVVQMLDKPLKSLTGSESGQGVIQVFRSALAPPLTRRGRAFTAAVIFERKSAHDAMAKAFLNPQAMSDIAKFSHHNRLTREASELAVSLGLVTE